MIWSGRSTEPPGPVGPAAPGGPCTVAIREVAARIGAAAEAAGTEAAYLRRLTLRLAHASRGAGVSAAAACVLDRAGQLHRERELWLSTATALGRYATACEASGAADGAGGSRVVRCGSDPLMVQARRELVAALTWVGVPAGPQTGAVRGQLRPRSAAGPLAGIPANPRMGSTSDGSGTTVPADNGFQFQGYPGGDPEWPKHQIQQLLPFRPL